MKGLIQAAVLAVVLIGAPCAQADEASAANPIAEALAGALKAAQTDTDRVHPASTTSLCNNSLYITNANGAVSGRQTNGCAAYGNQKFARDMVRQVATNMGFALVYSTTGFDLYRTPNTFTNVDGGNVYAMVHYDRSDMSSEVTYFNERVY